MPPRVPRPFGMCPHCKRKSRAAIIHGKDGETFVHYSATHPNSQDFVPLRARIRPDQSERLKQEPNQSAAVRAALDLYFSTR